MKQICRCGVKIDTEKGESLKSYFSNENGMRVTVCDNCAEKYELNKLYCTEDGIRYKKYTSQVYDIKTAIQQKTPIPN